MSISTFDLFSIGIGPSSSHTLGPMRAALNFAKTLEKNENFENITRITVELYGSLAWTGKGHASDTAVLLGLSGKIPEEVHPDEISNIVNQITLQGSLRLIGRISIPFHIENDFMFNKKEVMPYHSNGMRFCAFYEQRCILEEVYYSVGGGFVVHEADIDNPDTAISISIDVSYPFKTSAQLLEICTKTNKPIHEIMLANEKTWRSETEIRRDLLKIWSTMNQCIQRGCESFDTHLPGGLGVKRRAPDLYQRLRGQEHKLFENTAGTDWLSCYAIAVNEENASGGRVVSAPTNGAAGIIPSVLKYYTQFYKEVNDEGIIRFLLTASAIGILYKLGASISAADVGCQGEVGVACSMAAAGLVGALRGDHFQIEHAAEMGMEHHLGLTCDPIGGLVQIPCIERNAMGAIQAVACARLALLDGGQHKVSLDQVIKTMRETGKDMSTKYKETSQGGLAVSVPGC